MTRRLDPATLRQYAAKLRAGAVLRLYQPIAEKIKRHVLIAASSERSLAFLINSAPSLFIQRQPDLLLRQVVMLKIDHNFMQHDSYIACHDTVRLDSSHELAVGLHDGTIELIGYVAVSLYPTIGEAANGSRIIAPRDAELIARAFRIP